MRNPSDSMDSSNSIERYLLFIKPLGETFGMEEVFAVGYLDLLSCLYAAKTDHALVFTAFLFVFLLAGVGREEGGSWDVGEVEFDLLA